MDENELLNEGERLKREDEILQNESSQLEAVNSNLNALINNQDASIWSIDTQYNYVLFNDFFKQVNKDIFGVELKRGLNSLSILPADIADFWKEKYDQALLGKQVRFEFVADTNDEAHIYDIALNPVISKQKIIGVSALSIEITEQKKAEQALLDSNTNMSAIMENTLESIWAINTNYEILYSNTVFTNSFLNSFGVKLKKGTNLLESLPDTLKPVWKARYDRALSNERFSFVDEINLDESIIYVEVSMNPIIRNNKVIGASFFANDISKRINALKALEENEQRLKESNVTKDKFFSIIAHDLKSPFNSIVGLSDLLVSSSEKGEDIERIAKIIQKSSHQAMNLITNLLEWARSQSGKIAFNPEYFNVTSILREEITAFESKSNKKQITINNKVNSNTIIFADKHMVSFIFRNLISNALKFTHCKGQITISSQLRNEEIIFSVIDNGVGIYPDDIPKLFVIDQSYSTIGTDNEQGTGLGLILCKEFTGKHKGRIWAKSKKNKGSEFYFSLPVNTI
ncbi:PAS domain-containing sensor histidine kinase [Carboxylicivirga sp. A043]|uniref:sensor histidine kinase n=1 Tax=Carboxylicivirga litoralis TaxID=2816963 RepID=UPI0021CB7C5A|nr:PAS domain-containing sensor histidine kinase [Carboxylicivirga sp. A043]MCU4154465.1 PAS domain-containing sensor histidine kinase [Carboxylicivirga sp. A043]